LPRLSGLRNGAVRAVAAYLGLPTGKHLRRLREYAEIRSSLGQ
jgi:hypothetical protein